jgi:2,3-bisphosphoglycerate-independent phosphoglycerate mutase
MKPVVLIILDGWGIAKPGKGNAIYLAKTPNFDYFRKVYPYTELMASGNEIGLPEGNQGTSEQGHLTIGAGRIVWQPLEMINQAITTGEFFRKKEFLDAIENCKRNHSSLHIMGLTSDEGVHAHINHTLALLELSKRKGLKRVFIHCFLDGRDVPEKSALKYIRIIERKIKHSGIGKIASVVGRYYAMDRDSNWDRTEKAYRMLVYGEGFKAGSAEEAIRKAYKRGDKTDYYVKPTVIVDRKGVPLGLIKDNDSVIFTNYRSDRARQITYAFVSKKFEHFERTPLDIHFVCMSRYDERLKLPVVFVQEEVKNNLGKVISQSGKKQLRIAETEKYAHVTFFFNSQVDKPYKGEDRIMIPSPKVPSYDMKPEMNVYEVTERVLEEIRKKDYDFIVLNYANPDLVGHSGVLKAVVRCCEIVDECLGKVVNEVLEKGGIALVMGDHGNAEQMFYPRTRTVCPSHTTNKVPFILISKSERLRGCELRKNRGLKDVAPTILEIMGLGKPREMTGESLIIRNPFFH